VRVVWSPSALQEIIDIYNYIANRNRRAAGNLIEALLKGGDSLETFPHRGRPVGNNLRELTVVHPIGDEVTTLRVRHGRRRP